MQTSRIREVYERIYFGGCDPALRREVSSWTNDEPTIYCYILMHAYFCLLSLHVLTLSRHT